MFCDALADCYQGGVNLKLATWRKVPALKTGAGAVNSVRVTLKGNSITPYFNDHLWYSLTGAQPSGGGTIGFIFGGEKSSPSVWTFTSLKVTDVPQ